MKNLIRISIVVSITLLLSFCGKDGEEPVVRKNVIVGSMLKSTGIDTIMIITEPGLLFDIRIAQDTVRGPKPAPIPIPRIITTSGRIEQVKSWNPKEGINFLLLPKNSNSSSSSSSSSSDQDTIRRISVFYGESETPVYIDCKSGQLVPVPCPSEPGGTLWVRCEDGSVVNCQDTIH